MLDKILLALGFIGTIFGLAFVQGKRSEKNKQNRNAVKKVRQVQESKKRIAGLSHAEKLNRL